MELLSNLFKDPEPTPCDALNVEEKYDSGPSILVELPRIQTKIDGKIKYIDPENPLSIRVEIDADDKEVKYFSKTPLGNGEYAGGSLVMYTRRANAEEGIEEHARLVNTWSQDTLTKPAIQKELTGKYHGQNILTGAFASSTIKDDAFTQHQLRPTIFSWEPMNNNDKMLEIMSDVASVIEKHPRLAEVRECMDYTLEHGRYKNRDFADHRQHLPMIKYLIENTRSQLNK